MSESPRVGVLGATSLVGRCLLPLLFRRGRSVLAVSRSASEPAGDGTAEIGWCRPGSQQLADGEPVADWISLCPLWAVPEQAAWLEQLGCRRLVVLSSMSLVTKASSPDPAERQVANRLARAEADVLAWADGGAIRLTILRPTMIYDGARDGNVAAIAAWVRRFGWFPLCGPATGLRQPVHVGDVAAACLAALDRDFVTRRFLLHDPAGAGPDAEAGEHGSATRCYPLSGGEALPFRELVVRTCRAHGLTPRTVSIPAGVWHALAAVARGLRIARGPLAGVGQRMNEDLSCGHAAAAADFGFRPRPFVPGGTPATASADPVDSRLLSPGVQR
jgi:nucleoside-diphosphate-sugar epimerase